jgi:type II secretory pathway pseudopilin PulG
MTAPFRSERGFTILELLVSLAIMIGVTITIFALVDPGRGTYRAQPEVSDMQQRLRVGSSFLTNDLLMAGAGSKRGGRTRGSLMNYFAPVQPVRIGLTNSDPENGVFFRNDAVSIYFIPPEGPESTLSRWMPQPSAELQLEIEPSCPDDLPLSCRFKEGQHLLIFDETGAWDDLVTTHVQDEAGSDRVGTAGFLQHNNRFPGNRLSKQYDAGAMVAAVSQRTYYLNAATNQLMFYDGWMRDEAVIDNAVGLQFEYFGDPRPPAVVEMPSGEDFTTYGPKPPAEGIVASASWPPGENCIFSRVGGVITPRIGDLSPGSNNLVPLTAPMLTDGPWCPDPTFPTRFDADLLRIRKIAVRVRVQVASADLRGPAGLLFTRGGTSSNARLLVPDQEIRFQVTPRNFNLGR